MTLLSKFRLFFGDRRDAVKPTLRSTEGYTLLELIVVLLILVLIASIVTPQVFKYLGKAKTRSAELQIKAISSLLDFYHLDVERYPTQQEGLEALLTRPEDVANWVGPYISKPSSLVDPWGNLYRYQIPGEHGEYDLFSYGADNKEGGEGEAQDVVSW